MEQLIKKIGECVSRLDTKVEPILDSEVRVERQGVDEEETPDIHIVIGGDIAPSTSEEF